MELEIKELFLPDNTTLLPLATLMELAAVTGDDLQSAIVAWIDSDPAGMGGLINAQVV